ncbi:MAG: helix-turn-helix domain-containing protein [Lewinellaceae bacterium]|nr:helix-turn-helix domain-containing protein [Lewinellaceae bacterium]
MNYTKKLLRVVQLDQILDKYRILEKAPMPKMGWIRTVRLTLGMSMRQLGERLGISAQAVQQMEDREALGTITLDSLKTAARALDMKLVYTFLPAEGSLESMVEARAVELAQEMVLQSLQDLEPEERQKARPRIEKAILFKAVELQGKMGRGFWD